MFRQDVLKSLKLCSQFSITFDEEDEEETLLEVEEALFELDVEDD